MFRKLRYRSSGIEIASLLNETTIATRASTTPFIADSSKRANHSKGWDAKPLAYVLTE
jgi:hypothetical protein